MRKVAALPMTYVEAVEEAGGRAVILPVAGGGTPVDEILELVDALLVPGNYPFLPPALRALPGLREQAPLRYDSDVAWIRGALARKLPILAICRGMQTLNEVLGGTCYRRVHPPRSHHQDSPGEHPRHEVWVEPGTRLARALGKERVRANSFHVSAVRQPGKGLRVSARARDGVVEAIESVEEPFILGVQFHPELMRETEPAARGIFAAFVEAARGARQRRGALVPGVPGI